MGIHFNCVTVIRSIPSFCFTSYFLLYDVNLYSSPKSDSNTLDYNMICVKLDPLEQNFSLSGHVFISNIRRANMYFYNIRVQVVYHSALENPQHYFHKTVKMPVDCIELCACVTAQRIPIKEIGMRISIA